MALILRTGGSKSAGIIIFSDKIYRERVDNSDKRWLDDEIEVVFGRIVEYLEKFK